MDADEALRVVADPASAWNDVATAASVLAAEVRELRHELAMAKGALKFAGRGGFIGLAEAERLRAIAQRAREVRDGWDNPAHRPAALYILGLEGS